MAGENLFTRIPPESTGDRIQLRQSVVLPYGSKGGTDFILQDFYNLATSGIRIQVHEIYATDSTTGFLWCHFSDTAIFNGEVPTTGENINDLDGNTIAVVTAGYYTINTNANTTVGYNNPQIGQFVDRFGSAHIRVEEGNIGLDAFGKLRTSGATLLGEYVFSQGLLPQLFSNTKVGGGSIAWNQDRRFAEITVDAASGSQITHTSNTYHHYLPGSSHQFIGTFALGDTGKAGLVRNWGLFDSDNGFMFSQRNGEFGVVVRSSTSGTRVDTFISQSDFNKDTVDGTGLSDMNIDLTKDNIYWVDVQWLGGGRVRFGTYDRGQRVVMHEYYGGNAYTDALSQTASLPTCFSQTNTSGTSGASTMRSWCQAVYTETTFDITELGDGNNASLSTTVTGSLGVGEYAYIGSLTPKEFITGTQYNRSLYFPTSIDLIAWESSSGAEVLIEAEVYVNPVLSGLSLESTEYQSTVERDTSATFFGGTNNYAKAYIRGEKKIDFTDTFTNITYGAFKNNSEQGGQVTQPITNITNAATASITFDTSLYGQSSAREGNLYTFSNVGGMTEINGLGVYLQMTGTGSALAFSDAGLTQGVDTTTSGSYTTGGEIKGLYGSQNIFTIVCQKQRPTSDDIIVKAVVNWREIDQ